MRRQVPEPWATAMIEAGFTDPRYLDPRPSMSQLGQRIGVHVSTITSMVFGERETDQATIDAAAEALGVPAGTVAEWVGRSEANPYRPPSSASLLTSDEREHVDWIIRRLTRDRATAATGTGTGDVRAEVEAAEGVTRLTAGEMRGELRDAVRRRNDLVHSGRSLGPDDAQLLVVLTEKIARLEHALNPPQTASERAVETG